MNGAPSLPAPLDPFAAAPGRCYRDGLVVVRQGRRPATDDAVLVRTEHFDVLGGRDQVELAHGLDATSVDDDLAGLLAAQLFVPGWLRGGEMFERLFTGIVLTCADSAGQAWEAFYRNTLTAIEELLRAHDQASFTDPTGCIAGYAPIYAHVQELVRGQDVVDLGCCFGFASLRLAQAGFSVRALDLAPGSVRLLAEMAQRLQVPLRAEVADATALPTQCAPADTVIALHLLEHLEAEEGQVAFDQALGLARQRLIVAVPLEEEADPTYGHVRTISLDDLRTWGRDSGLSFSVHEYHGGWLILDRAA